jgi:phenylalanyl-tRNA synthetase beta subunit
MPRTVRKGADQVLLLALACGATVENAAHKAGISERTAYRRLDDPAFVQQLDQLRADMVKRTAGMLTGAGMGSVKTLVDLQNDVAVPSGVRRRSARDILEMGLKFRETAELEQRLAAVEARLAGAADAELECHETNQSQ